MTNAHYRIVVTERQVNQIGGRQDEGPKRATNVSLSERLITEARALNVSVSRACESGLQAAVRQARAERWQTENEAGFEAWNAYVEQNGVPLAQYRKF
jgi:antitoxin CcdA